MIQNLKKRNLITRKDIVTNKIFNRDEMIRISISKIGITVIDRNLNLGGRGIYIHPSSIIIGFEKNIIKKNIKRFNGNIENIKEELIKEAK